MHPETFPLFSKTCGVVFALQNWELFDNGRGVFSTLTGTTIEMLIEEPKLIVLTTASVVVQTLVELLAAGLSNILQATAVHEMRYTTLVRVQ